MSKMLITEEQYHSLTPIGKEIHKYWMDFKPKMYREMEQAGTLWETLSSEDKRLDDLACNLITVQGMSVDMAMEVVRAQIYDEMMD